MIKEIKGKLGKELINKNIIHCITSSVSIYKAIDISRFLIKHGANIIPVLSKEACKLINPELFRFATGNEPIYKITGRIEHVSIFKEGIDFVLIAPATANTISKISHGISDTIVTLIASIALGKNIPLIICPTMHEPMYKNRILVENINRLKEKGVLFIEPRIEEEKAKIALEEEIFFCLLNSIYKKDLKEKKILVTSGATREYIDNIRFITNPSSGKMGIEMAKEAYLRGGNVLLIHGDMKVNIPNYLESIYVETSEEMLNEVSKILRKNKIDYFISCAAVSDFKPSFKHEGKIESKKIKKLKIELVTTPKIIEKIKKISSKTFLVAFKAEYGINEKNIINKVKEYAFCDVIILNDVSRKDIGFGSDYNEVYIYNKKEKKIEKIEKKEKKEIAKIIWDKIIKCVR